MATRRRPPPARARDEWLAGTEADRTAHGWTVERWLRHWLDGRTRIRPTTRFHYTRNVENILILYLGRYRLADHDSRLLRTVFAQIAATTNGKGRPQSASAMQHLRTTLRAALNLAVREGLLDVGCQVPWGPSSRRRTSFHVQRCRVFSHTITRCQRKRSSAWKACLATACLN